MSEEWRDIEEAPDYQVSVHRLVLEAFVGPCPPGCETRHLNGNPADNRLCNLAWGTHRENAADKVRHGTAPRGERNPSAKLTEADVREVRTLVEQGYTQRDIADRFDVGPIAICHIVTRKAWKHVE